MHHQRNRTITGEPTTMGKNARLLAPIHAGKFSVGFFPPLQLSLNQLAMDLHVRVFLAEFS